MAESLDLHDAWIVYTNWRGETRRRHIAPLLLFYGENEWHVGETWLLEAYDLEREHDRLRTFAMAGIRAWAATPEALPGPAEDEATRLAVALETLETAIDPALLDRLAERYAADDQPVPCEICGGNLVKARETLLWGDQRWECPEGHLGGTRYLEAGDPDVLALLAAIRGEAAPDAL